MRPLSLLLTLATAALLAADLSAQSIQKVSPSVGSLGSVLSIQYSGDLGKGKPKVWLTAADDESGKPKPFKAKVVDVIPTEGGAGATILAELKKVVYGSFDVNVQPKVKGLGPVVAAGAFAAVAPTVMTGPTPATANPGDEVSLMVMNAGNKAPKLSIGGKKAKAKLDGEQGDLQTITFQIPKSLPNGVWPIEIATKAGTSDAGVSVEVVGSSKSLGKAFLTASIDGGKALKYTGKKLSIANVGNSLQILATSLTNPSKSVTIIVPFVDVGTFTQFTLPIGASISYAELSAGAGGSFSSKTWQTNVPPIEVVITSVSGGQFAGTFSGTLVSLNGDPDITISGEFIGDAQTF